MNCMIVGIHISEMDDLVNRIDEKGYYPELNEDLKAHFFDVSLLRVFDFYNFSLSDLSIRDMIKSDIRPNNLHIDYNSLNDDTETIRINAYCSDGTVDEIEEEAEMVALLYNGEPIRFTYRDYLKNCGALTDCWIQIVLDLKEMGVGIGFDYKLLYKGTLGDSFVKANNPDDLSGFEYSFHRFELNYFETLSTGYGDITILMDKVAYMRRATGGNIIVPNGIESFIIADMCTSNIHIVLPKSVKFCSFYCSPSLSISLLISKDFDKGILNSLVRSLLNEIVDISKLSNDTVLDLLRAVGVNIEYY